LEGAGGGCMSSYVPNWFAMTFRRGSDGLIVVSYPDRRHFVCKTLDLFLKMESDLLCRCGNRNRRPSLPVGHLRLTVLCGEKVNNAVFNNQDPSKLTIGMSTADTIGPCPRPTSSLDHAAPSRRPDLHQTMRSSPPQTNTHNAIPGPGPSSLASRDGDRYRDRDGERSDIGEAHRHPSSCPVPHEGWTNGSCLTDREDKESHRRRRRPKSQSINPDAEDDDEGAEEEEDEQDGSVGAIQEEPTWGSYSQPSNCPA
jgi:hypothetical protein